MDVALVGNSPSTITAGIMLLTRARQLGFPLTVSILGDESDLKVVPGPAVIYAPVLSSCGVGREHGSGATVVVPGPPGAPVMVSVAPHGVGEWFLVDRTGEGCHPATRAFTRLASDKRPAAREAARALTDALAVFGLPAEPAVLDVLFGAPVPPLLRTALALRAGRAMTKGRGKSLTMMLTGDLSAAGEPFDPAEGSPALLAQIAAGDLDWMYDRISPAVRESLRDWVGTLLSLGADDDHRDVDLLLGLAELGTHLAQLPSHSILPPLGAAEDSVAVALQSALEATGEGDANKSMDQIYRFLGGRFVDEAMHPLVVSTTPAPEGEAEDPVAVWQWFAQEARIGRKRADALWEDIFDPASLRGRRGELLERFGADARPGAGRLEVDATG